MIKLNLGAGDRYVDGWVNVDRAECPHRKDQVADLTAPLLPWEPGTVSHVYAGHLYEHLTKDQCYRLSAELLRIMSPAEGAILMIVGPDLHVARQMIDDGTFDHTYHSLESLRHGGHRWPGDEHQWETTGPRVYQIVKMAGWPAVSVGTVADVDQTWPVADRTQPWQYSVRAYCGPMTGFPGKKSRLR